MPTSQDSNPLNRIEFQALRMRLPASQEIRGQQGKEQAEGYEKDSKDLK